MEIGVLDFGGNFVGPSLGLMSLGHRVRWFGARGVEAPLALTSRDCVEPTPPLDAELVILAASFADESWAAEVGIQLDQPWDPKDPLRASINPKQRGVRDAWIDEHVDCKRLVLVDVSDCGERLDPWFAQRGAVRFQRERPLWDWPVDVEPFPFLYHPQMLELEFCGRLVDVILAPDQREGRDEVLFCGTVDHWRYFGARRRELSLLERQGLANRETQLRIVPCGLPPLELWRELQHARAGLYLHGRGQLCFRLHELAALGVPMLAPTPWGIQVPRAWHDIVRRDLDSLPEPLEILSFYHDHYHPCRAAEWLLRGIEGAAQPPVELASGSAR